MDNIKLAKLIDLIVQKRLKRVLNSQEFDVLVEKIVSKRIDKLLLRESSLKKTRINTSLSSLFSEDEDLEEEVLVKQQIQGKTFSKNPLLDNILKKTAISTIANLNNAQIDMAALQNESYAFAKSNMRGSGKLIDESLPLSKHTVSSDIVSDNPEDSVDLSQVDPSTIIHQPNNDALMSAFTRDYSELLKTTEEKSKVRRGVIK